MVIMDNLKIYDGIFMDVFSVEKEALNSDFKKENVDNWDSIHQLSLMTGIEDSFDIMFDTEDAFKISSYEGCKELLATKYDIEF